MISVTCTNAPLRTKFNKTSAPTYVFGWSHGFTATSIIRPWTSILTTVASPNDNCFIIISIIDMIDGHMICVVFAYSPFLIKFNHFVTNNDTTWLATKPTHFVPQFLDIILFFGGFWTINFNFFESHIITLHYIESDSYFSCFNGPLNNVVGDIFY